MYRCTRKNSKKNTSTLPDSERRQKGGTSTQQELIFLLSEAPAFFFFAASLNVFVILSFKILSSLRFFFALFCDFFVPSLICQKKNTRRGGVMVSSQINAKVHCQTGFMDERGVHKLILHTVALALFRQFMNCSGNFLTFILSRLSSAFERSL